MKAIPDYLLERKPELKFSKNRQSQHYKKNINAVVDWLIDVEEYIFNQEIEKFHIESTSEENLEQARIYIPARSNPISKELNELYLECQRFNPELSRSSFLKMLNLSGKPKRGRPSGKTPETENLDYSVDYYRRLRALLNAEYGVEAKDALLTRISNDLFVSKSKLEAHLKRPRKRVNPQQPT